MSQSSLHRRTAVVVRLLLGSSVVSIALGIVGAGLWVARPDHAHVAVVEFPGAHHASEPALRHLSEIRYGMRVWEVDTDTVARAVERHPWVASADAELIWPDTVRVHVAEKQPLATVLTPNGLHYVDEAGVAFLRADAAEADLPVLTGVSADLVQQHPELPGLVIRASLDLIDDLDTRGLVDRARLSGVHFSSTRGFTVTVGQVRLVFGLDDHERQTDRLASLVRNGVVSFDRPLHVDLVPETVAIVRDRAHLGDG